MRILIIMGVAGSGKTTIGRLLSKKLGWPFFEGDDFHSVSNLQKMGRGKPLTDSDRLPWLKQIRQKIDELIEQNQSAIIACSSLKQAYREILSAGTDKKVTFVYLKGGRNLILRRIKQRTEHFMKAGMLDSQFEVLEEPQKEAIVVDASQAPNKIIQQIIVDILPKPRYSKRSFTHPEDY